MSVQAKLARKDGTVIRAQVEDQSEVIHMGVTYRRSGNSHRVGAGGPDIMTFHEVAVSAKPKDVYTQQLTDEWLDELGDGARRDMLR